MLPPYFQLGLFPLSIEYLIQNELFAFLESVFQSLQLRQAYKVLYIFPFS